MSDYTVRTLSTVQATKHTSSSTHSATSTKKTATPVLTSTSHSSTPTIDSLLPTTMVTLTKSSSTAWSYPLPPSASSAKSNSTSSTSSTKLQADLKTYKLHYRNMIIALTLFALVFVAFIAFKIWRFVKARKSKNGTVQRERKWYGGLASGLASALTKKKNSRYEEIEISGPQRPQRPQTAYLPGSGPGGAQMI